MNFRGRCFPNNDPKLKIPKQTGRVIESTTNIHMIPSSEILVHETEVTDIGRDMKRWKAMQSAFKLLKISPRDICIITESPCARNKYSGIE